MPALYEALGQLPDTRSEMALARWHTNLRSQEGTLWKAVDPPIRNPPPYAFRLALQPTPAHDQIRLIDPIPQNEPGITASILAPSLRNLVSDFFQDTGVTVLSSAVDVAAENGSGTSDIGLRKTQELEEQVWSTMQKFLIEIKLLSPEACLRGVHVDADTPGLEKSTSLCARRA